jgi:hypothetical protein
MSNSELSPEHQVEAARKAFEQEFERFVPFVDDPSALTKLDLETVALRAKASTSLCRGAARVRDIGTRSPCCANAWKTFL